MIEELANKMRLENILKRDVRSIFVRMSRDFTTSVRAIGRVPDAEVYNASFNGTLLQHYVRTQNSFKGTALDISMTDGQESLTDLALLEWRRTTAIEQSQIITNTNARQMEESLALGRDELVQTDITPTPNALARVSTAILVNRFLFGRTTVIAETETQGAAESTKQIEAEVAAGQRPFPLQNVIAEPLQEQRDVTKKWQTVGDSRVRPSHVRQNGVTIPNKAIFNIEGSRLRFPGDTGLGAAFNLIVNCRCSSVYAIE